MYCSGPVYNVLSCGVHSMLPSWSKTQRIVLARSTGHVHDVLSWSGMQVMQTTYCPGQVHMLLSWSGTQSIALTARFSLFVMDRFHFPHL